MATEARLLLCVVFSAIFLKTSAQSPILIVPGLTGSQLSAKVNSSSFLCDTNGRYDRIWVSLTRLLDGCSEAELTLNYNSTDNTYVNSSNVQVTAPGFGDTHTVEYMDEILGVRSFEYLNVFVSYFVTRGYVRGINITAAPYDWRLAADNLQLTGYYSQLINLVQEMYENNGQKKVTLVGHSMGGPVTLYFLTRVVGQEWKDRYINAFVPLSGAWGGSNSVLQYEISGMDLSTALSACPSAQSVIIFPTLVSNLRSALRSLESMSWMLPEPSLWGDTVLVTTPNRNYTAHDYKALFMDIGHPQGYDMYQGIVSLNQDYPSPGVPTHCFYGIGVGTPVNFVYDNGFPDANPTSVTCGNGDGSITLDSSRICLQWAGSNVSFTSRTFEGTTHVGMVSNKTVLEALAEIVGAPLNLDRNLRSSANTTNASGLLATINCLFIVLLAFNFLI